MHAEGGTGPEHSISVARSKKLFQWFEGCPRNPIFNTQKSGNGLIRLSMRDMETLWMMDMETGM